MTYAGAFRFRLSRAPLLAAALGLVLLFSAGFAHSGSLVGRATLQRGLESLVDGFDGRAGICADDGVSPICVNGEQSFPMQSVVKLVVAAAAMDAVDHGRLNLDEAVIVRREDLSLYVQPLAKEVFAQGGRAEFTIRDLVARAVTASDSAASDILYARVGGSDGIGAFLERSGTEGVRVDRDERQLQTEIVGLRWRPEFVDASVLEKAIKAVPEALRDKTFGEYLKDKRDTATPKGMVTFLTALAAGKLLSSRSSQFLLEVMNRTVTFPDRLQAGTPPDWRCGHKTGTSSTWKGMNAVTADTGVLTAPDGGSVAVVAFLAESRRDAKDLAALIARVARTVTAAYH